MIHLDWVNREEIHQMQKHRWIESERAQKDLGEEAYLDWIKKYAAGFREWVTSLPGYCVGCGHCGRDSTGDCPQPFDERRLKFIEKKIISK